VSNTPKRRLAGNAHHPRCYGRLVIERDLTKEEVKALELALSVPNRPPTLSFDGWKIYTYDIRVNQEKSNVAFLTVKGIA